MPKISVNIPCYNSAAFIRETLESVLSQTYGDFEIIVMDDGSSDDTAKIVKSFTDSRVKYFYKDNEGLSETRNKGIAISSGEYIAFLDHDDLWLPDKLEKQIALFKKKDGLGVVFSDFFLLKNGCRESATYFSKCQPKRGYIFDDLLFDEAGFICISTVMIRKAIFEEVGYFKKEFESGEECEFFLRAAKDNEFDYIDEPLASYRLHAGNFSNRKDIYVKEAFDILRLWQVKEPGLFVQNKKKLAMRKANIFADAANFYVLNYKKKEAAHNFKLSLEHYMNVSVFIKKWILIFFGCGGYKILNGFYGALRRYAGSMKKVAQADCGIER